MLAVCPVASAQSPPPPAPPQTPQQDEVPFITLGNRKIRFGVDILFAGVLNQSLRAGMGRERQIKIGYAIVAAYGDLTDRISYRIEMNPADDSVRPKPYIPAEGDRRTYFFPNQPEGRGVVSDPDGLIEVDAYKHPGFDPILQRGALRTATIDIHTSGRRYGLIAGRMYVPQGFGLHEAPWYTDKDLTHIQRINAQADHGLGLYYDTPRFRIDLVAVSGNGNPYHDYGYYDFTNPAEDKNSLLGGVLTGRLRFSHLEAGGSFRKNYVNSRIEDAITIQLSKHNDDALVGFARYRFSPGATLFGEYARYTWGLAESSAVLLKGPPNKTPIIKDGFYIGLDLRSAETKWGRFGLTVTHERLSRDDALVAWAAANGLFGVCLGETERSSIVKLRAEFGRYLDGFFFFHRLDNPFPELSAIREISGPGSDRPNNSNKYGLGLRLTM